MNRWLFRVSPIILKRFYLRSFVKPHYDKVQSRRKGHMRHEEYRQSHIALLIEWIEKQAIIDTIEHDPEHIGGHSVAPYREQRSYNNTRQEEYKTKDPG
jgi:hypothetical protein